MKTYEVSLRDRVSTTGQRVGCPLSGFWVWKDRPRGRVSTAGQWGWYLRWGGTAGLADRTRASRTPAVDPHSLPARNACPASLAARSLHASRANPAMLLNASLADPAPAACQPRPPSTCRLPASALKNPPRLFFLPSGAGGGPLATVKPGCRCAQQAAEQILEAFELYLQPLLPQARRVVALGMPGMPWACPDAVPCLSAAPHCCSSSAPAYARCCLATILPTAADSVKS